MDTSPRDRITVDLQGLKGALVARAEAEGVMPSELVRQVLQKALRVDGLSAQAAAQRPAALPRRRLCVRMQAEEVRAVMAGAKRAGQRPGRWLAALASGAPAAADKDALASHRAALVAISAELAALRRALQQLMLRLGPASPTELRIPLQELSQTLQLHLAAMTAQLTPGLKGGHASERGRRRLPSVRGGS